MDFANAKGSPILLSTLRSGGRDAISYSGSAFENEGSRRTTSSEMPTTSQPKPLQITHERKASIDKFVSDHANATSWVDDNGGENVGRALNGGPELGALSVDEQRYLSDRSVAAWKSRQSRETIREAAEAVRDNPNAREALAEAMSRPAAEAEKHFANGGQYIETPGASSFRHAMLDQAINLDAGATVRNFGGVEARLGKIAMQSLGHVKRPGYCQPARKYPCGQGGPRGPLDKI